MPIHLLPVFITGVVLAKGWWLVRLFDNNFDLKKTNEQFLRDIRWDKIRDFGATALDSLRPISDGAEILYELQKDYVIEIDSYADFERIVRELASQRRRFEGLSETFRNLVDPNRRTLQLLEARMNKAALGYASLLGSIDSGARSEQISALYMSLYLLGRLNADIPKESRTEFVRRLIKLHRGRRRKLDGEIAGLLEGKLDASTAKDLVEKLSELECIKVLQIETDHIVGVLRKRTPDLEFPPLFDEMVEMVEKNSKKRAA